MLISEFPHKSNWDNAISRGINGTGVRDLGSVINWPYDLVRPMFLSRTVHGIWGGTFFIWNCPQAASFSIPGLYPLSISTNLTFI